MFSLSCKALLCLKTIYNFSTMVIIIISVKLGGARLARKPCIYVLP